MTVVGEQLPHACERCDSPFFYYRRATYDYVLTPADREFLRAGGIATDDADPKPPVVSS
jgi:hypothetical protein